MNTEPLNMHGHAALQAERDEARAEVERLRAVVDIARDFVTSPSSHDDARHWRRLRDALAELDRRQV